MPGRAARDRLGQPRDTWKRGCERRGVGAPRILTPFSGPCNGIIMLSSDMIGGSSTHQPAEHALRWGRRTEKEKEKGLQLPMHLRVPSPANKDHHMGFALALARWVHALAEPYHFRNG